MEAIYNVCCGIDVHKMKLVACLRKGRRQEIKEFGAQTKEIKAMTNWLMENKCEMIAMESTSTYWKPLVNIFEMNDLDFIIINAKDYRALPGRKTDKKDSEWISELLQHGLLKASYIPTRNQRELRDVTRLRKSITEERTRYLNRLHKFLENANIKLGSFVSNINGKSSRNLLDYVLSNEGELEVSAIEGMISSRVKASAEELKEALDGIITPVQRVLMKEIFIRIEETTASIARMDDLIEAAMVDYCAEIEKLQAIPGIGEHSAQVILAEIGLDMSRFRTAGHLASWAGVAPGNNESAGKRKSGRTRNGNKTLKATLTQCAKSAAKNKNSFFYAQYQKIAIRRGKNRATMAVAHSMLIAIYHILKEDKEFKDLGADYYSKFNAEKKANSYIKKLAALGYEVELKTSA